MLTLDSRKTLLKQVLSVPFITYAHVIYMPQINLNERTSLPIFRYITQVKMRVWLGITIDQKRNSNFLEDEIMAMVEEFEASQHVLFSGLNSVTN